MAINVVCDCGKAYSVTDKHAGKSLKCPACGQRMAVPTLVMPTIMIDSDEPAADEPDAPTAWMRVRNGAKRAATSIASDLKGRDPAESGFKTAENVLNSSTPFEREVLSKMDQGLRLLVRIEGATNTIRYIMLLPFIIAGAVIILAIAMVFITALMQGH